jgi:hypothetical protein
MPGHYGSSNGKKKAHAKGLASYGKGKASTRKATDARNANKVTKIQRDIKMSKQVKKLPRRK